MTAHQAGWATVVLCVAFGTVACCFGFLAGLSLLSLVVVPDAFSWRHISYVGPPGFLHLFTAAASTRTVVLRLDGRPAAHWAAISLGMASATLAVITTWWPHYFFFGM